MKVVKGILVVLMILLGIFFFSVNEKGAGIFLILVGLFIWKFMPTKSTKAQFKDARKQYLKNSGAIENFSGTHVGGLPIGEVPCGVTFFKDKAVIDGGGSTFSIDIEKIKGVFIKPDTEIKNEISSSMAQGVVGGLLFGPAGAIIGSRVKTKTSRETTMYLIMNYLNKDNTLDSICIDLGTFGGKSNDPFQPSMMELNGRLLNVICLLPNNKNTSEEVIKL